MAVDEHDEGGDPACWAHLVDTPVEGPGSPPTVAGVDEILTALTEQQRELDDVLASLTEPQWATPTPRCPGWTVTDVILHLSQTDELAIASVTGRFPYKLEVLAGGSAPAEVSVDAGAAALVDRERGAPPSEVYDRWRSGAASLLRAFGQIEPGARVQWVMGDMAARTLATTRLAECWIHTGDVLAAFDRPIEPASRLRHVARLAWRTIPYAMSSAGQRLSGPVRFDLTGPAGERWEFAPEEPAATTITGPALDLCLVAGQRMPASRSSLRGSGPDADAVLSLVRTFA